MGKNGICYKVYKFGESDKKPVPTDYITVDIEYRTTDKDSVFFSVRRKFQTTLPDYAGSIDECISMMSVGDSASFIISAANFFYKTLKAPLPSFFNSRSNIKINIKLLNIQSRADFVKEKEQFMAWTNGLGDYEKTLLQQFLKEKDLSVQPTKSGLYCIKTVETNGAVVKGGCNIVVHYEGQFLNGKYFDSTKKRNMPFDFMFGKEMQVVPGLEEGIGMMREGESAVLIMPSQLAFGTGGSSSGIIPPFTTVIFKVELLSVKCRN